MDPNLLDEHDEGKMLFGLSPSQARSLPSSHSMEMLTRMCRSTGPKEVLIKLAAHRHLLLLQLSALKIQAVARQYLARMRYHRMQRHFDYFQRITNECASQLLEEAILSTVIEVAFAAIRADRAVQQLRRRVETIIAAEANQILEEVVERECYDATIETVTMISSGYLILQKYGSIQNYLLQERLKMSEEQKKLNPLLNILYLLTDEVSDGFAKSIVIEAIEEEVMDYLLSTCSKNILNWLLLSPSFEMEGLSVLLQCLDENFSQKSPGQQLLREVELQMLAKEQIQKNEDDAAITACEKRKFEERSKNDFMSESGGQQVSLKHEIAGLFVANLFSEYFKRKPNES